jgi:hypothetical protein
MDIRDEILSELGHLGKRYPAMRFGQLVAFVAFLSKGPTQSAVWDVEDAEFLENTKQHLAGRAEQSTNGEGGTKAS